MRTFCQRLVVDLRSLWIQGVPYYLLFRLTDIVVDHYFFVVEHVNDLVLNLEEQVLESAEPYLREDILNLKR